MNICRHNIYYMIQIHDTHHGCNCLPFAETQDFEAEHHVVKSMLVRLPDPGEPVGGGMKIMKSSGVSSRVDLVSLELLISLWP